MTAVERSLRHGLQQPERRDNGTRGQHLDLELAAGHVVHFLREVERVLVKDIFRWPRRLPAHVDRALRLGNHWEPEGGDARRGTAGGTKELAALRCCRWPLRNGLLQFAEH